MPKKTPRSGNRSSAAPARRASSRNQSNLPAGCTLHATGLTLPANLSEPNWRKVGLALAGQRSQLKWAIADWWVFGEHRYGERRALVSAENWSGPGFQTCMHMGRVAKAFPKPADRQQALTFSHHEAVASRHPAEADALLNWCKPPRGRARTVRELRAEIDRRDREKQEQRTAKAQAHTPHITITGEPGPSPGFIETTPLTTLTAPPRVLSYDLEQAIHTILRVDPADIIHLLERRSFAIEEPKIRNQRSMSQDIQAVIDKLLEIKAMIDREKPTLRLVHQNKSDE
jgi:hypothetical protein